MTLLGDIAAARAALDSADTDLRAARAARDTALRAREEATARGDRAAADAASADIAAADTLLGHLEPGRRAALGTLASLRSQLLAATGDPLTLANGALPLLLLPVRLETRFAWQHPADPSRRTFTRPGPGPAATPLLLVRVFPDDVHVDSHDPALTPQELFWQRQFLTRTRAAHDREPFIAAWEELLRRAGPQRAAWIAQAARRPGVPAAADRWGRAPRAALLPDCWIAQAWVGDQPAGSAMGALVREPIDLAPDPARAAPGGDGLRWLVDFDDALAAGMALVIPLPPTTGPPPVVQRLVVVGAHVSRDPTASTAALEALLDAHHYTHGLSFIRPGAATNALPGERPDRTTRPTARDLFAVEGDTWPLTPAATLVDDLPADGWDAAVLLGVDPAVFGHVSGADGRCRQAGRDIRWLLAAASLGLLQHLLAPLIGRDTLEAAAGFLIDAVDGLGPIPALRIGDQPYGILPVTQAGQADLDLDPFERLLVPVLQALRAEVWEPATVTLPRIGGPPPPGTPPPDPTTTLLALLRSDAVARGLAIRPALGPQVAGAVTAALDPARAATLATARQAVADLLARLAGGPAVPPPLAQLLLLADAAPVRAPLIQPELPGPGQSADQYLDMLSFRAAGTGPSLLDLAEETIPLPGGRPHALLFELARLALLATADRASRGLLREAGVADDASLAAWDGEIDPGPFAATFPYALPARLRATLPTGPPEPIHSLLLSASPPAGSEFFLNTLAAVRSLASPPGNPAVRPASHPPELLDLVLRSELGLLSHRLDAWFTGLATQRLRRLRNSTGLQRGLVVGGYGVLLDISPVPLSNPLPPSELPPGGPGEAFRNTANAGYVHAPSVAHAATAAVLRSAHLAQWQATRGEAQPTRDAFSIDLSSGRVRTALGLLDGVREGQLLAALLGYRIERRLRDAAASPAIAVLRRAAPLLAGRLTPSGTAPVEQVAAANVVDGLRLLELAGAGDTATVTAAFRPYLGGLSGSDWGKAASAVAAAISDARDAVDAVADLLTAEGVFQLVRGNPARSAGGTDAISGAGTPPPDPEVAASARSGVALTHRAAVALPAADAEPADESAGWARTPRARLEPALERWARAVLPAPGTTTVLFAAEPGGPVTHTATLAALQQAAHDAGAPSLRLGALDVVAAAGPDGRPSLEARLVAMARHADPSAVVAAVVATRPPAAAPPAASLAELLETGAAMRALLLDSRPLRADDLAPPGAPAAATATPGPALDRVDAAAGAVRAASNALAAAAETARRHLTGTGPPASDADLAADRAALTDALLTADSLGVSQAVPIGPLLTPAGSHADAAALVPLAAAVAATLDARLAAHGALAASAAGEPARPAWAYERAQALLGPTGWVLPALDAPTPGEPGPLTAATPAGATAEAARLALGRYALVRPGMARLDRVLGHVEALHATVPVLTVTQRPLAPGERWVALEPAAGERTAGGRVAVLAHSPFPGEAGPVAALLVDDWTEVVPNTHETTSLSFHYDAPSSAAPNVLLLAVPSPNAEHWSANVAITLVEEALALAHLRAVDPDALTGAGQLLPALLSLEQTSPGISATLDAATLTTPAKSP